MSPKPKEGIRESIYAVEGRRKGQCACQVQAAEAGGVRKKIREVKKEHRLDYSRGGLGNNRTYQKKAGTRHFKGPKPIGGGKKEKEENY